MEFHFQFCKEDFAECRTFPFFVFFFFSNRFFFIKNTNGVFIVPVKGTSKVSETIISVAIKGNYFFLTEMAKTRVINYEQSDKVRWE